MNRIFFVMPAYNEEDNIENVVRQWHEIVEKLQHSGVSAKLVIANDGSKDSTLMRLKQLEGDYPLLVALDKPNSGHGATLMYLYRYALENSADYIFQTDSDGQTNPEEFLQMWTERNKWDFQVGHRIGRQDGFSRIIVTKVLKIVVRLTFGVYVTDANTPFRLMKASSVSKIMKLIPDDFFLSNVAISALAVKGGYKCRWIPITFKPRQGGVNSINLPRIFKIGQKAVGDFIRINRSSRK